MKNIIFIDIDTEREKVVQIGKPTDTPKPTTPEDAKKMILEDIACAIEGLCSLIHIADQNKYEDKAVLVNESVNHLNNMLKVVEPATK